MAARTAKAERTSAETQIRLSLNLDGEGKVHVDTGFGMLDHMLTLTFFWARITQRRTALWSSAARFWRLWGTGPASPAWAMAAFPWTRLSAR